MFLGIDIVEIERIRKAVRSGQGGFVSRVYTHSERACIGDPDINAERAAGFWAAKEAAVKALGTGFSDGITLHDIEISHESTGRPCCTFRGRFDQIAREKKIRSVAVSISHCRDYAVAAIILK